MVARKVILLKYWKENKKKNKTVNQESYIMQIYSLETKENKKILVKQKSNLTLIGLS